MLSDGGKAEVCDLGAANAIYKDVRLGTCKNYCEARARSTAYPFEIPMDYVAVVKIIKAFSNITYLGRE